MLQQLQTQLEESSLIGIHTHLILCTENLGISTTALAEPKTNQRGKCKRKSLLVCTIKCLKQLVTLQKAYKNILEKYYALQSIIEKIEKFTA